MMLSGYELPFSVIFDFSLGSGSWLFTLERHIYECFGKWFDLHDYLQPIDNTIINYELTHLGTS